jgi:hypothetical protein
MRPVDTGRMNKFSWTSLLVRLVLSLALVLATFNPSGHSFFHWATAGGGAFRPIVVVTGLALLIAWIVFLKATTAAIGVLGLVLIVAFLAAVSWLFASWGWYDPANTTTLTWVALVVLAMVLAIGLSWASIRQRLTGQASVDEVRHG